MYYIFIGILIISIVVLATEFAYIFKNMSSKLHSYLMVLLIASFINNLGYLKEIFSTNLKEALVGTRICYLGKPFIPIIVLFLIYDYCGIKIASWIKYTLMVCQGLISILVITCTSHTLFYSKISYSFEGIFPHLVLKHGVMYYVFMAITCGCFIASLFALIHRYIHFRRRAEKVMIPYLFAMIIIAALGLILFSLGVTGGYDTTAPAFCIGAILILYSLVRYNLIDTVNTAKSFAVENLTEGIVVADSLNDPVYANKVANEVLPDIIKEINNSSTEKSREYVNYLKNVVRVNKMLFADKRVYKVINQKLIKNNLDMGNMFILHDVSDGYYYTEKLERAVEEKTRDIESIQHSIISSFANIIEARDGDTGAHIKNTSAYVEILVNAMLNDEHFFRALDERLAKLIIEAAPLHDIGKIGVSDQILNKPGILTPEEYEIMKAHTTKGAEIINDTLSSVEKEDYIHIAHDMALYHHEKWDGTGYPEGLKDLDIPLCARIMAIVDVYDALRSKRCYKPAFSAAKAREIIREGAGVYFDPVMVDLFFYNIEKIEKIAEESLELKEEKEYKDEKN